MKKCIRLARELSGAKLDAEKKTNRAKTHGSRPGDLEYEPVQESFVLVDECYNIFELTKATVL